MTIHRIIGYSLQINENAPNVKVYDDDSEKFISDEVSAIEYANYLAGKNLFVDRDQITVLPSIDVIAKKKADALALLTDEQKQLLNLL